MEEKKIIIGKGDVLLVVDTQNDFMLKKGKLFVAGVKGEPSMKEIIARIKSLWQKKFDLRITSEDEHCSNHIEFSIFGEHCLVGTEGQKYHRSLRNVRRSADWKMKKGDNANIISYSVSTGSNFIFLIDDLREKGIERIFVIGLAYTHCAGESAIDLSMQGFETYLVRDVTRSVRPPYGDPIVMATKLKLYGVKEINFRDIR
jgi:nicotinamidase/pyrazinamidase